MNKLLKNLSSIPQVMFRLLDIIESRQYTAIMILGLAATISLSTLVFRPSFVWGPDIPFHIYNAQNYLVEMKLGILFPRWLGDWFGGYGAPIGVIYAPLLYVCSAFIGLTGLDIISSIKVVLWISMFLSGVFMYDLAKISMRSSSALLAGVLFQIAPYRLIDIVGRTALTEALAFTWLPLIVLSMINLAQKQRRIYFIKFTLAISLLILTHLLIAYLCLISLVFFGGFLVFSKKMNRLKTAISIILALILAFLLTAFYWLPAVVESRYLNTDWFVAGSGWGYYVNNFLFGDRAYLNTISENLYRENTLISFVAILYGFIGALWILQRSIRNKDYEVKNESEYKHLDYWMFFLLCMSIFMSLSISKPFWELLPRGELVAFPWRWLTLSTLAVAYLAGDLSHQALSMVSSDKAIQGNFLRIVYSFFLGTVIIYTMTSAYFLWHHKGILPEELVSQLLGKNQLQTRNFGWVYADEYLPLVASKFDYYTYPAYNQSKLLALHPIEFRIIKWTSSIREITIFSKEKNTVNIKTFWFPGWKIYVNDEEVAVSIEATDGTMTIKLPEGDSDVNVIFEATPIRVLASKISLVGLALLVIIILARRGSLVQGINRPDNKHP